jgi:hypothetical protein
MAVRLSALPRKIPGTHFCQRLSRPQGHSEAGRIRSVEESNDFNASRTRDLPACSTVPEPTTLPDMNKTRPTVQALARRTYIGRQTDVKTKTAFSCSWELKGCKSAKISGSIFLTVLVLYHSSAVDIVIGYGLDDRGVGVPSPDRVKNFLFSTSSRLALGSTQQPIQ